jgi:hypothetical protein
MHNIDTTLLGSGEMYDLIVDVVGNETSLEFVTLTSYYLDGNDLDTAMRANGTDWRTIKPLVEEIEERAGQIRVKEADRSGGDKTDG